MSQFEIYIAGKGYVCTVEGSKRYAEKTAKQLAIQYGALEPAGKGASYDTGSTVDAYRINKL